MSIQLNTQTKRDRLNHDVKQGFSIGESDLADNRAGKMSQRQYLRLEEKQTNTTMLLLGGFAIFLVFVFITLATANRTPSPAPTKGKPDVGEALFAVGVLALAAGVNLYRLKQITDDLHSEDVLSIQGPVKLSPRLGKGTHYQIISDSKTFKVSQEIYEGFEKGERYILYYTPASMTLIAAEQPPH